AHTQRRLLFVTACRRKRFLRRPAVESGPVSAGPRGLPTMTEPSAIDAASKRLALALDALAAAVERRHEADRGEQTLDAQLHALGADRSRLASELDAAVARTRTLEITNREVAQRLDAAIDTIRSVLAAHER